MREKDGLWAVLFWLNLLAVRRQSVAEIVREHWRRFGRNYYTRHDYEGVDSAGARGSDGSTCAPCCRRCRASTWAASTWSMPTTSPTPTPSTARSRAPGLRIGFEGGSRIVLRLSGTGTEGATLRVYLEFYEADPARHDQDTQEALEPLIDAAEALTGLRARSGQARPTVIT